MNEESQEITVEKIEDVTVITPGQEFTNLDTESLTRLHQLVLDVTESLDPPLLIIDMRHTTFFASSFIEILTRAWNRVNRREGGQFALCSLNEHCAEVMAVTKLEQLWGIYETREEALAAVKAGQ